jgi:hypothetical protein
MIPCAENGGRSGSYGRNRVVIVSCLLTYFGGMAVKTAMYAKTVAGNNRRSPAKKASQNPRPSDAGSANDRNKPRVTHPTLCHHIGSMGAAQRGQLSYGRRLLVPRLRSAEQLGQRPQALFVSSCARKFLRRVAHPFVSTILRADIARWADNTTPIAHY